jgi:HK97 family phage prohead protease
MIERKAIRQFLTKAIDDRAVTGVFAVHGHIDDSGDRSFPGLFTDPTVNGRSRARVVWQHRTDQPPTATINSIRELTRDELPPAVLAYAPDATGGVEVVRTYLPTPRGNEILEGIKTGAIDEMSYAYDAIKYDFEETERGMVRNLYKAHLYDISDVLWGLNPATVAAKGQPMAEQTQAVLAAVKDLVSRYESLAALRAKDGRVLSSETRERIRSIRDGIDPGVDALIAVKTALNELLAATEPGKSLADDHQLRAEWQRMQPRIASLMREGVHLL